MFDSSGIFINGEWRHKKIEQASAVYNPSTEEIIGTVAVATEQDLDDAVATAQKAFNKWRHTNPWERAAILRKVAQLLRERAAEIVVVMSTETGKPMSESIGELGAAAEQFDWYAGETQRIRGESIEARDRATRMNVIYQPVGVVAAFSAWNFPVLLPARKIAAALAAGCSVIVKPACETPYSCAALVQACADAGLPAGAINMVTGEPEMISHYLVRSESVRKVSLTGSTRVGKEILKVAADGIKKVTMELGGHAPVIVFEDFDGADAAKIVAASKFRNCGQVCVSPTRFYVHESQYDSFAQAFADYANSLKLGAGTEEGVTMGPMANARGLRRAFELIDDALAKGAELLAGGKAAEGFDKGYFIEATVLGNVPASSRIMSEEPFAPIAPIARFSSYEEVIEQANRLPWGLASYLFTKSLKIATLAAEDIEAGMVGVNEVLLASAEMPFGGVKESGYGREGGSLGIYDYLAPKFIKAKLV